MRHVFVVLVAGFLCLVGAGMGAMVFFAGQLSNGYATKDIKGTDLNGTARKLSDHKGKVVLLVFWSSSDPDNQETQAYLRRLQRTFDGQPFVIVGVNGDGSEAQARAAAGDHNYHSFY